MSVPVNFGNKVIIEPGVYAQTKAAVEAQPVAFPFGNVMIIDTGSGKNWGGGSGINGELEQGLNSVYAFSSLQDFRNFTKGGEIWDYSQHVMETGLGVPAPDLLYFVRAAQTTGARISFNFTNGSVNFICRNEGNVGNGYLDETRAKLILTFVDASIIVGNTFVLTIDSEEIANITATSTSPAEFKQLLVDTINNGGSGYAAEIQGLNVVILAPRGLGVLPNTYVVTTSGTVTANTSATMQGGVLGEKVINGFGAQFSAGDVTDTFKIEFYQGTFSGKAPNGEYYGLNNEENSDPVIVATTPDFTTMDELIAWAQNDNAFNRAFVLAEDYSQSGDGTFDATDINTYNDIVLASGGAEEYRPEDLDRVLEDIREMGNTFFLADRYGEEALSVQNMKILDHILTNAEFEKFMVVGGGKDNTEFKDTENSSVEIAKTFDSVRAIVVHSGNKRRNRLSGNLEELPAIHHAAAVVGRLGGLNPQDPLTFKRLAMDNYLHTMNQSEREMALQAGVLHNRDVEGIGSVVNQGINTLQKNKQQINPDGTSHEISIMSIGAQLNKELVLNLRPLFIGLNKRQVTKADVRSFVENYLFNSSIGNGLIVRFQNVTVDLQQGYYDIKYYYEPNGPINKMFLTGFMLDTNSL